MKTESSSPLVPFPYYPEKYRQTNFNGRIPRDERVTDLPGWRVDAHQRVCRDWAALYCKTVSADPNWKDGDFLAGIQTREGATNAMTGASNEAYSEFWDAPGHVSCHTAEFGGWLVRVLDGLDRRGLTGATLHIDTTPHACVPGPLILGHSLAVSLRIKQSKEAGETQPGEVSPLRRDGDKTYVIRVHDSNKTPTHKRVPVPARRAAEILGPLGIADFLGPGILPKLYFLLNSKTLDIVSLDVNLELLLRQQSLPSHPVRRVT